MSDAVFYILKWADGSFVERDDSTGPMSSGGYPLKTNNINRATRFESISKAAAYAQVCRWKDMMEVVFPLEFFLGEPIPYESKWTHCNHHCVRSSESTQPTAKHYLDCSIMQDRLS